MHNSLVLLEGMLVSLPAERVNFLADLLLLPVDLIKLPAGFVRWLALLIAYTQSTGWR